MDRDTKFCESFRSFLSNEGIEPFRLPPRSPNMNAHLERFFGSLKSECLDRLILFGERSMRNAVNQYLEYYHSERPHQGLSNELIVQCSHRLRWTARSKPPNAWVAYFDRIAALRDLGFRAFFHESRLGRCCVLIKLDINFGHLGTTSRPISAQISTSTCSLNSFFIAQNVRSIFLHHGVICLAS